MASVVDICNLALSHLGDEANISSIAPPDESVQAQYCARLYPIALGSMLERHAWAFATRRTLLAQVPIDTPQWSFGFALPADFISLIRPLDAGANDIADYDIEVLSSGARVLYCSVDAVELIYTGTVNNTALFPPLFVDALSLLLAQHLAGPILKGDVGVAAATKMLQLFAPALKLAVESDCKSRKTSHRPTPAGISARA